MCLLLEWHVGITFNFGMTEINTSITILFWPVFVVMGSLLLRFAVTHDEIPSDRRMYFSQDINFMFSIVLITSTPWQMCHKLTTILSLTLKMIIGLYRS